MAKIDSLCEGKIMNRKSMMCIAFVLFFQSINLHAASFDCAKAASKVEKMICNHDVLSDLDEQLSITYKAAVESSLDRNAFREAQLIWLKERNGCEAAACLENMYRSRINDLAEGRSNVVDANRSLVSSPTQSRYQLINGAQYEVCRVFNDYLNSTYYEEGDCFVGQYPPDKRLSSPTFRPADVEQFRSQYVEFLRKDKTFEEKTRLSRIDNILIDRGQVRFWKFEADLDNDHRTEFFVMTELLTESNAKKNRCASLSSKNIFPVEGDKFSKKWGGRLESSIPFIFDGRTFIAYGGSSLGFSIAEPFPNDGKHISPDVFAKTFVCEYKNLNYVP